MQNIAEVNKIIAEKGGAFLTSPMTDQRKFYNLRATVYDKQNMISYRVNRRKIVNNIYKQYLKSLLENKKIDYLDFGCGTGLATVDFMNELNFLDIRNAYGIDISEEMLKKAKSRLNHFELYNGGVESLKNFRFDLLTAFFHVLCHFNDNELEDFFKLSKENLSKNGLICFDVIKRYDIGEHGFTLDDDINNRIYVAYNSLDADGKIIEDNNIPIIGTDRLFSKIEIEKFAQKFGFRLIACEEVQIPNPDPKVGFLREYVVVMQNIT